MTLLKDVMSRHYETLDPDISLKDARRQLETLNLGLLLVCRDRHVLGVLEAVELQRRLSEPGCDPVESRVRDVMSDNVLVGREEQDVRDLVTPMRERSIHTIPVLDADSRIVGVFTLGGPWKRLPAIASRE